MPSVNSRKIGGFDADEILLLRENIESNVQETFNEVFNTIDEIKNKSTQEIFLLSQEILSAGKIELSKIPKVSHETYLIVQNAAPQIYGVDFSVSGKFLTWQNLGLDGLLSEGDLLSVVYPIADRIFEETTIQETRTLSENEVFEKQLNLQNVPSVGHELRLVPIGGGPQVFGLDYDVRGTVLSWEGKGLDFLLSPGDTVYLSYPTLLEASE